MSGVSELSGRHDLPSHALASRDYPRFAGQGLISLVDTRDDNNHNHNAEYQTTTRANFRSR